MSTTLRLTEASQRCQQALESAIEALNEQRQKLTELGEGTPTEEIEFHEGVFRKCEENVARRQKELERQMAVDRAWQDVPRLDETDEPDTGLAATRVNVMKEPRTYRPDVNISFFRDIWTSSKGDRGAADRLSRHQEETKNEIAQLKREQRDVTTGDPGAGVFVPPIYLSELWANFPRAGRPFADSLPTMPLPSLGMSFTIPRVTTATAVGTQIAEGDAVTETDIDGTLLTVPVSTIAGQNDVSRQALERTEPGLDFLIFQDLRADYDRKLDTQLLAGTGANGQMLGIRAVSGINTVTYTDGSPTAAELVPNIYNAIQKVATNRFLPASAIVIHPTTAAWLASNLSSTFPLFQLGTLLQAAGSQSAGFVDNFAGLKTVLDPNIGTTYGAGTNQSEIYVVHAADLILMEGGLRTAVYEQTLSGTLQVRLQVFSYSAFISGRWPSGITTISGTGLVGQFS